MDALEIAICEDSPSERERLLALLSAAGETVRCSSFASGEDFLAVFRPGKFDLVIMDIYMGGMTGLEAIAEVRRSDEDVLVAFASTSTEHTLESYRLDAFKYIEKPVEKKAVSELLQLARLKRAGRPHVTVRADGSQVDVLLERIIFVEQRAHELLIHMTEGENLLISEKLDELEPQLADGDFFRCHKSYLVNLAYVESFDRELMIFTMNDGKNVHIRRESLGDARRAYEEYLFGTARRMEDE